MDISKCSGLNCPLKDECYRYNANSSLVWQSWIQPEFKIIGKGKNHVECSHFWKDTHKPKKQIIRNNIQKSE